MTSQKQKWRPTVVLGVKRRHATWYPSPSMHSEGKGPSKTSPPSWPRVRKFNSDWEGIWILHNCALPAKHVTNAARILQFWPPAWRRCYGDVTSMNIIPGLLNNSMSFVIYMCYMSKVMQWSFYMGSLTTHTLESTKVDQCIFHIIVWWYAIHWAFLLFCTSWLLDAFEIKEASIVVFIQS